MDAESAAGQQLAACLDLRGIRPNKQQAQYAGGRRRVMREPTRLSQEAAGAPGRHHHRPK
ncbi:hypothetical protein J31TS4_44270 [Paenibacillus sp. J31TS4]|nr:hypothetical protein J31TS4_44270 [Paenibacillus sp. J31TS4]